MLVHCPKNLDFTVFQKVSLSNLIFCLAGFLGSGKALGAFVLLIVWNILYIFYQDRIVFPETFSNYGAYQQTTPFLIPDRNSTAACIKTWRKGGKRR